MFSHWVITLSGGKWLKIDWDTADFVSLWRMHWPPNKSASTARTAHRIKNLRRQSCRTGSLLHIYRFWLSWVKNPGQGTDSAARPPAGACCCFGGKGHCTIKHPRCQKVKPNSKFYEYNIKEDMFPLGYHFGLWKLVKNWVRYWPILSPLPAHREWMGPQISGPPEQKPHIEMEKNC